MPIELDCDGCFCEIEMEEKIFCKDCYEDICKKLEKAEECIKDLAMKKISKEKNDTREN